MRDSDSRERGRERERERESVCVCVNEREYIERMSLYSSLNFCLSQQKQMKSFSPTNNGFRGKKTFVVVVVVVFVVVAVPVNVVLLSAVFNYIDISNSKSSIFFRLKTLHHKFHHY